MRDDLVRLLEGIPRESAPEIPLERLLHRVTAIRRRALVLAGFGILGLVGLATSFEPSPGPAPKHLEIHVIEMDGVPRWGAGGGTPRGRASDEGPSDAGRGDVGDQPEEFDRP